MELINKFGAWANRYFEVKKRKSTIGTEVRGGIVTFFTMAYIVILNPLIIGTQTDSTGQYLGGGSVGQAMLLVAAGTALIAGLMTILMGAYAKFPLALATGLGLNAFVAFGIAKLPGMTWNMAMGLVVLEGIIILLLVLSGFRTAVFKAVPKQLKTAISVGIGLFITYIGFVDAGFVRKAPATPTELGIGGFLAGWPTLVFIVGLLIIIALIIKKVHGAMLYGILGATVLAVVLQSIFKIGSQTDAAGKIVNPTGWGLNVPAIPNSVVSLPDLSLFGHFDMFGAFTAVGFITAALLVFTLMLSDFFDTMGTMVAIGDEAKLLDRDGLPPETERILIVDSLAAIAGGAAGVSSNTSYIESASGVGEGARTGIASIVTGLLFLLAMFFVPIVGIIPYEAATPALIIVGFLMMQQVREIKWDDIDIALPAFLTIVLMPYTYSITAGIGAGFIAYVFIKLVRGKAAQIQPLMWVISMLFVVYFAMDPIKALLGVK